MLNLTIPLKPLSVNHTSCVNRGKIQKTKEYNFFIKDFGTILLLKNKTIREYIINFDPRIHTLKLMCQFGIPKKKMLTTKGGISKRSSDVDNYLKSTTDALFKTLSKYNRNVDDAYIVELVAKKFISDDYVINLTLEILDLDTFLT